MTGAYLTTGILVLLVLGMYFMASVARKRLGIGAGTVTPDQLRIVGRRNLDRTKSLYVVEIADRYVLLGAAEGSVSLVDHITAEEFAQMTDADEVRATAAATRERLARVGRKVVPLGGGTSKSDSTASGDADEPRFATVGESFALLMNKARRSRTAHAGATTDGATALALTTAPGVEQDPED